MRLFLLFLLGAALLHSIELEPDKIYTGPKKLTVSSLGASMGVPVGWQAVARKGEGLKLFQGTTEDTIVLRAQKMTVSEAVDYLEKAHFTAGGKKIFPTEGIIKLTPRIFRRAYSASGGRDKATGLIYVILGPQERAVVMQADYDSENDSSVKATTMSITQTLTFTPTEQLKTAYVDLELRLRGIHAVFMRDEKGFEGKSELWLCSDRRYLLREEHMSAGGSAIAPEQISGSWSVEDAKLVLRGDDGRVLLIGVELRDKALLFDGYRSYELANHRCR